MGTPGRLFSILFLLVTATGSGLCSHLRKTSADHAVLQNSSAFSLKDLGEEAISSLPKYKAAQRILRWTFYPSPSLTVSKSGHANFSTVQSAINYAQTLGRPHVVILILPGTYNEKVVVNRSDVSIMLTGLDASRTIIQYNDNAGKKGTFWSCSVCIAANNFVAANLTFKNNADWPGKVDSSSRHTRMAVALRISGTAAAFYNCIFSGWQDTLYDHKGLHFFRGCYIEGVVDFVFGGGQSIYEGCTFSVRANSLPGGSVFAQKRLDASDASGFVILRSLITGSRKVYLGRAWGPASRVILAYSLISDVVAQGAWNDWGYPSRQLTSFFAQFSCSGPGANMSKWADWTMSLSYSEAKPFLRYSFINANAWLGPSPPGTSMASPFQVQTGKSYSRPPCFPSFSSSEPPALSSMHTVRGAVSRVQGHASWRAISKIFPPDM